MKTKALAAGFAALFLANVSYAQDKRVEWGLRFGIGGTELYDLEALTDNFEVDRGLLGEDEWDDDHLTSLSGGISLAVRVAGHWGIETGAYYQRKGAKLRRHYDLRTSPTAPAATDYTSHSTTEIKLHYVRIPAMVRYSRQIFSSPVVWELKLGPYFAYAFKGEADVRYNERPQQTAPVSTTLTPRGLLNPNAPRDSYDLFADADMTQALRSFNTRASGDITYESRRLDVGGTVGGGITLWRKLYVGAQYDIGITSVMQIGGIWQNNGADKQKLRNNTMTFQVGYNF